MVAYRRSIRPRFRGPRVSPVRGASGRGNIETLARSLADRIIRERDAAAQRKAKQLPKCKVQTGKLASNLSTYEAPCQIKF